MVRAKGHGMGLHTSGSTKDILLDKYTASLGLSFDPVEEALAFRNS